MPSRRRFPSKQKKDYFDRAQHQVIFDHHTKNKSTLIFKLKSKSIAIPYTEIKLMSTTHFTSKSVHPQTEIKSSSTPHTETKSSSILYSESNSSATISTKSKPISILKL